MHLPACSMTTCNLTLLFPQETPLQVGGKNF